MSKKSRTLNRNKPFAEVMGPSPDGHRYEQDGIMFDGAGVEMGTAGESEALTSVDAGIVDINVEGEPVVPVEGEPVVPVEGEPVVEGGASEA
jgi:hypothetical protein